MGDARENIDLYFIGRDWPFYLEWWCRKRHGKHHMTIRREEQRPRLGRDVVWCRKCDEYF